MKRRRAFSSKIFLWSPALMSIASTAGIVSRYTRAQLVVVGAVGGEQHVIGAEEIMCAHQGGGIPWIAVWQ